MCVAGVAIAAHPRWRLVLAGNRDEFHARPTAPLARWENGMIAGRDLQAGGTWAGVAENGRFALVTNYRVDGYPRPELASRGALVTDWLEARAPHGIAGMNPFNLLLVAPDGAWPNGAWHISNHPAPDRRALTPGIHGLSNGGFDDRWAKTHAVEAALAEWLDSGFETDDSGFAPLFAALRDETPLHGEGPEPRFSPVFIRNPVYGTRCSTVMAIDAAGHGRVVERRFDADGAETGRSEIAFRWP